MRKNIKKAVLGTVAGALTVAMYIPSFAANITYTYSPGGVTNYIKTDSYKGYENYPCWIWYQGYCYYYDQNGNYLTNTTTPDGYSVDALGRWTVNGNPIHNGAGNYKMGTEDYNGKSDDEIWSLMKEKLIPVYQDAIIGWDYDGPDADGLPIHIDQYAYGYGNDIVWTDNDTSTYGGYGETAVTHNDQRFGTFVTAGIGNYWSDLERTYNNAISKAYYANKVDIKEKTIKAVVGDKIGTELFNYIKQHADKIIPDAEWNPYNMADGIMPSKLDFSAWQNRKTDYGKTFSIEVVGEGIKIKVYK